MPSVNKVVYGNNTLIDLTSDTVTPNDVLRGATFHDRSGTSQTGAVDTHTMTPTPNASLTRSDLQTAIASAVTEGGINDDVVSAWAVGNWSNTMTQRVIYSGTIAVGDTGIGTWLTQEQFEELEAISDLTTREAMEVGTGGYGWWKDAHFLGLDTFDDYDIVFKYKLTDTGEIITLGGYYLDTDTGCMCIKFGSEIKNAGNVIAVDIIVVQNNISTSGGS